MWSCPPAAEGIRLVLGLLCTVFRYSRQRLTIVGFLKTTNDDLGFGDDAVTSVDLGVLGTMTSAHSPQSSYLTPHYHVGSPGTERRDGLLGCYVLIHTGITLADDLTSTSFVSRTRVSTAR